MNIKLEDIGFYTLSNKRAESASSASPLWRCELLLTDRCNFKCPYCRGVKKEMSGDVSIGMAREIVSMWVRDGLRNIRFSGGEPTLWKDLERIVGYTQSLGVNRIAISTNGSASVKLYERLILAGVNDVSVSLDACCSATGKLMCGGVSGAWELVVDNIRALSKLSYTTVGVVLDERNVSDLAETIRFADSLGVADIRIIPSAQYGARLKEDVARDIGRIGPEILGKHPILKYRMNNLLNGRPFRGLSESDSHSCFLVLDDMAVLSGFHFPCIVYMREGGSPIGKVGPNMRLDRERWYRSHDTHHDPICKGNCLDVCVDYNNSAWKYRIGPERLSPEVFDWQSWRDGTPMDIGLFCRTGSLTTEWGKKILQGSVLGYCLGEKLLVRPKPNTVAVMVKKNDYHFWFHITKLEFQAIFPGVLGARS